MTFKKNLRKKLSSKFFSGTRIPSNTKKFSSLSLNWKQTMTNNLKSSKLRVALRSDGTGDSTKRDSPFSFSLKRTTSD